MSTGYGLTIFFFKFVKILAIKPNRRGCGARESIQKSHSRLLPPQGGLAEAARKGGYGQDTGSVDPSQAKCEYALNNDFLLANHKVTTFDLKETSRRFVDFPTCICNKVHIINHTGNKV